MYAIALITRGLLPCLTVDADRNVDAHINHDWNGIRSFIKLETWLDHRS